MRKLLCSVVLLFALSLPVYAETTIDQWELQDMIKRMADGQPVKIVAFGDSITYGDIGDGPRAETPYPQALQTRLQALYNNPNITVINEGRNGQRTDQAILEFDIDVIAQDPDIVIIMYGLNDNSGKTGRINDIPIYKNNLSIMVEKAKEHQIVPVLLSPTPAFYADNKINNRILSYVAAVQEVAKKHNVTYMNSNEKVYEWYWSKTISPLAMHSDAAHFRTETYPLFADLVAAEIFDRYGVHRIVGERENVSFPVVNSSYMESDITGISRSTKQFQGKNYFIYKDGSRGSYVTFTFYQHLKGKDLYLLTPKSRVGGVLTVYDNGFPLKKVDYYSPETVYDQEELLIRNISPGYHTIEFNIHHLESGESGTDNPMMYLSALEFRESQ